MRISEMNTEEMSRTLCRIAGPMERIGTDKDVNDAFSKIAESMGEGTNLAKISLVVGQIAPVLLGAHFEDTVEIVAAMTGKTAKEVREQSGMQTIKDVGSFFDEDFAVFFGSSETQEQEK